MALSGQTTVTTAGAAVPLGTAAVNAPVSIKALDTNTGIVAIGNDGAGDVTLSNGYRLAPGDVHVFIYLGNLSSMWLDSAVNGEGISWIVLDA
jgi:hypothetical protein